MKIFNRSALAGGGVQKNVLGRDPNQLSTGCSWYDLKTPSPSTEPLNELWIACLQSQLLYVKFVVFSNVCINLLKSTGHVMHQQFNIQQLYVLPPLYLCVLYLSENKQRIVPLTA